MRKKTRIHWILLLIIGLLVLGLFYYFRLSEFFTIETFKLNRDRLVAITSRYPFASIIIFIAIYIVDILLALPTAALLTVIGGYLFGVGPGALFSLIGAVIGAYCLFLFTRYFFGHSLQAKYETRLEKINLEIKHNGVYYMIVLRLLPFVPFVLVNVLLGLSRVTSIDFLWTTALGLLPSTILYALAGEQLQHITSLSDVISFKALSTLTLLAILFVVPIVVQFIRKPR